MMKKRICGGWWIWNKCSVIILMIVLRVLCAQVADIWVVVPPLLKIRLHKYWVIVYINWVRLHFSVSYNNNKDHEMLSFISKSHWKVFSLLGKEGRAHWLWIWTFSSGIDQYVTKQYHFNLMGMWNSFLGMEHAQWKRNIQNQSKFCPPSLKHPLLNYTKQFNYFNAKIWKVLLGIVWS